MTEYFSRILICLAALIIVFSDCVAAEIPDMKAVIQKGPFLSLVHWQCWWFCLAIASIMFIRNRLRLRICCVRQI